MVNILKGADNERADCLGSGLACARPAHYRPLLQAADPVKPVPGPPTMRLLPYVSTPPPPTAEMAPLVLLSSNVVSTSAAGFVPFA